MLLEDWRIEYNTKRPHSSLGLALPGRLSRALGGSATRWTLISGGLAKGVRSPPPTPPPPSLDVSRTRVLPRRRPPLSALDVPSGHAPPRPSPTRTPTHGRVDRRAPAALPRPHRGAAGDPRRAPHRPRLLRATAFTADVVFRVPGRPITWFTGDPSTHTLDYAEGGRGVLTLPAGDGEAPGSSSCSERTPPRPTTSASCVHRGPRAHRLRVLLTHSDDLDAAVVLPVEIGRLTAAFERSPRTARVREDRVGYVGLSGRRIADHRRRRPARGRRGCRLRRCDRAVLRRREPRRLGALGELPRARRRRGVGPRAHLRARRPQHPPRIAR